jgi:hypothetical protein
MQKRVVFVVFLSFILLISTVSLAIAAEQNTGKSFNLFDKLKKGAFGIVDSFLGLFGKSVQLSPGECMDDSQCSYGSCLNGFCTCNDINCEAACDDNLDNDGNGLVDCVDPACVANGRPGTLGHICCASVFDCAGQCENLELGCSCNAQAYPNTCWDALETCGDGVDNNGDGKIDCFDALCMGTEECKGCDPNCEGKQCGDDGCGNSCGDCSTGETCDEGTGQCEQDLCLNVACGSCETCNPETGQCESSGTCCSSDADCGDCESCQSGGTCVSKCTEAQMCENGECKDCQPQCDNRQCGDDGCGGECTPGCTGTQTCDETGQCVDNTDCNPGDTDSCLNLGKGDCGYANCEGDGTWNFAECKSGSDCNKKCSDPEGYPGIDAKSCSEIDKSYSCGSSECVQFEGENPYWNVAACYASGDTEDCYVLGLGETGQATCQSDGNWDASGCDNQCVGQSPETKPAHAEYSVGPVVGNVIGNAVGGFVGKIFGSKPKSQEKVVIEFFEAKLKDFTDRFIQPTIDALKGNNNCKPKEGASVQCKQNNLYAGAGEISVSLSNTDNNCPLLGLSKTDDFAVELDSSEAVKVNCVVALQQKLVRTITENVNNYKQPNCGIDAKVSVKSYNERVIDSDGNKVCGAKVHIDIVYKGMPSITSNIIVDANIQNFYECQEA